MKNWTLKIKSSHQEVVSKLESAFGSAKGFVFNMDHSDNNTKIFQLRRPVKYPDQILHRNRIVVKGKISDNGLSEESDLMISFTQHLYMSLTVFSIIVFGIGLIVIISRAKEGIAMFVLIAAILGVGLVLWMAYKRKFEKDIQEYKALLNGVLEPEGVS